MLCAMPHLSKQLDLDRCPHCGVHRPLLAGVWQQATTAYNGQNKREWVAYVCATCGGVVTAWSDRPGAQTWAVFPEAPTIVEDIPDPARDYLRQALDSIHAPAGAVMLAASAVDAMLKAKGLTKGDLYERIGEAVEQRLITDEMAAWAHEVRLDANDQRHADPKVPLPTTNDARRVVDFAQALGMFLFVLPERVTRGRASAEKQSEQKSSS